MTHTTHPDPHTCPARGFQIATQDEIDAEINLCYMRLMNRLEQADRAGEAKAIACVALAWSTGASVAVPQPPPEHAALDQDALDGCYRWHHFVERFVESWQKHFDAPPTLKHWQIARRDWLAGSTGWEAVQIAIHSDQERAETAARKPLVWLGGRNYAEAGSALALKYGIQKPQTDVEANEP